MVWQNVKCWKSDNINHTENNHLVNPINSLGIYVLNTTLNESNVVFRNSLLFQFYTEKWFSRFQHPWCTLAALIPAVAEPPELSRLKCAGHHHKGNISLNALQTEQFLVCRVTSRYNHRFSDRTSIPRTKASPEILQPQVLQHRHKMITNQF